METKRKSAKVAAGLLALAGLAVFSLFAVGGSLEPSAPPGPTMKTLDEVEPRIPIHASDLPLTITEPKSYYLVEDVNFASTANHAITIECNDVTIDLAGFSLIGPDSGTKSGIYINGRINVEISNGTIRDFGGPAIYAFGSASSRHRVINIRALSNGSGIYLYGKGHLVKDCTAGDADYDGIHPGDDCTITGNTAYNNGNEGIDTGNGCIVTGNTAYKNRIGINSAGLGSTVTGNTAYNNGGSGINTGGGSTVTGNTASFNTGDGIHVSSWCRVTDNTCYQNGFDGDGAGIYASGDDNRIERNNIINNDRGIDVDASGNVIADNMVKANTDNYDIAADNQINILLCEVPETIEWPATVTLAGSLTCAVVDAHAITVEANDVTIDLAGHALIGPDSGTGFGIYMYGRSNVEIRNGTVRDFLYGIHGFGNPSQDHRIIDVRSVSNGRHGINLLGKSHLVKDCTASDNGTSASSDVYGIHTGSGSTVTGNTARNNGNSAFAFGDVYGIYADKGSTVTGNTAYDNGTSAGFVCGISAGHGSTVTGNTAYHNGTSATNAMGSVCGIYANSGCMVTGNTAYDNGDSAAGSAYGIYLTGNNLVDQNTAYSNGTGAASATNMSACGSCTFGTNHAP